MSFWFDVYVMFTDVGLVGCWRVSRPVDGYLRRGLRIYIWRPGSRGVYLVIFTSRRRLLNEMMRRDKTRQRRNKREITLSDA